MRGGPALHRRARTTIGARQGCPRASTERLACCDAQWARSGRFRLFNHGSAAANRAHYGSAEPPDIAGDYGRLDIPVDIMAGVHMHSLLVYPCPRSFGWWPLFLASSLLHELRPGPGKAGLPAAAPPECLSRCSMHAPRALPACGSVSLSLTCSAPGQAAPTA